VDPPVERTIDNLLVNACRHTPQGTRIWIRVLAQDGGVLVCVEDEGPGVADELKTPIFEPFRKGDAGTPGSGIGLSLVARFAEFHAGRTWVQDRPGGGASFRVFFRTATTDRVHPARPGHRGRRESAKARNLGGLARVRTDVLVSRAGAGEDTPTLGPTGRPA
jgi:K+-sensing histidine kinase KdpD